MKRALILGLAIAFFPVACTVGLGTLILVGFSPMPPSKAGCEQRQVFAEAASPDGAWVARFYANFCGAGFGPDYSEDTLEIARPGEPPQPVPSAGVVFEVEDNFSNLPRPLALRWLDERKLEVTIPNAVWPGTQQEAYGDLAISYRYLNDDPSERACLKQWRALSFDERVRRSMSAKEHIKAYLAQCHAQRLHHYEARCPRRSFSQG